MTNQPRGTRGPLQVERQSGFWFARLSRPDKRNALSDELVAALGALWERIAADLEARALVLYGQGGNFCAGADFARFLELMQSAPG
ncbi:MAG: isohexenylglutaconyl-CoA hydratase, partial [Pseudomonadota bacterium]|nr:isohexenylglutaconyl-CoA hydratase [Pseudomonadota bacterium]